MILDRLDVAEEQISHLEKFRSDFFESERKLAVAESSLKRLSSLDTVQSTMLGVGCLVLGYIPTAWGNWSLTAVVAVSGIALVVASFISKRSNQ